MEAAGSLAAAGDSKFLPRWRADASLDDFLAGLLNLHGESIGQIADSLRERLKKDDSPRVAHFLMKLDPKLKPF